MSITDELREYVNQRPVPTKSQALMEVRERFNAIADRIDAEHERITHNLTDALHKQEDATRKLDEESVLLPVDADGVPIRLGDVMENVIHPPTHREVTGVGVECFYAWEDGQGRYSQFGANCYRHYHKPTVEDVLFEFAQFWSDEELTDIEHLQPDAAQTIADYAAKLQLRED